jgi:hypothetical protein
MESASWFRDEIGMSLLNEGKGKKKYLDPEHLYKFDGDRSIKTLHERNDKARERDENETDGSSNQSMDSASTSNSIKSPGDTTFTVGGNAQRTAALATRSSAERAQGVRGATEGG